MWSYVTKILVTYNINEHVSLSFVFVSLKTVTYLQFFAEKSEENIVNRKAYHGMKNVERQSTVSKKLAQHNCIETSQSCIIFQYFKNLCKTRQNIEESVVLFAKILAFTVYPGVLPFLIRKRGTPCPRNCLPSGSTNKSWYHLNQQQSSRVIYVLNTLTKIRSKLLRGMR